MTMFCTYKPKKCTLSNLTKKDQKGRFIWWLIPITIPLIVLAAAGIINSQTQRSMIPSGVNNDQMYCIANDWRSRDRKAQEFQTLINGRFSLPMTLKGKIPFGTMYCTFTPSCCTRLGYLLDNEQQAWNVVKAMKAKDDSVRTKKEKDILEKAKKLKVQYKKKGYKKAKLYKEIAKEIEDKSINSEI